ncbi:MAG: extracellular solute-binding protein [Anaerolineae bacterium]|nr:extracellular solute-binding protein [Anaerolineae bacterium]
MNKKQRLGLFVILAIVLTLALGSSVFAQEEDMSWVRNQEQWGRLPTDHELGTMITQEEWYEILGEPPTEPLTMTLFRGGFGEEWANVIVELMEREHPGVQIEVTFDPSIWEVMQPRIIAGEVPDFMFYTLGAWGGDWDVGVEENLVIPGDILLDIEGYGAYSDQRLGDLFVDGALLSANEGRTDHQWNFPQTQFTYGIFYNATMFEEHGWPRPDTLTWEEFMELQAEIAEVVAPWTYAGIYPTYYSWVTVPLMYMKAGDETWCARENLEPGAFNDPAYLWAIEQTQQIFANGWVYPGSDALDHTGSQQVFVDGLAAMIPNGSWLQNEQRSTTPEGFDMRFSAVPAPSDARGFAHAIQASLGAADMQIGNGTNPLWGMELMRMFYSPESAAFWAENIGSPLPLVGAAVDSPNPYTVSITDAIERAEGNYIFSRATDYPDVGRVFGDNFGDMLWSRISAIDYLANLERAAEETRSNPDIVKQTYCQ